MTIIRSIMISWILVLFSVGGCTANEPPKLTKSTEVNKAANSYVIDAQAGSIAGLTVGMTETQIREAGWPFETRFQNLEGDEYKIYDINLAEGIALKCTLDLDGVLARIESSSVEVQDQHGLGTGSRLSELKRSYPTGRLIKGTAEGRFANFLTGTRLIFYFNHTDLEESCFDYQQECTIDESIMVKSVAIGGYSPE